MEILPSPKLLDLPKATAAFFSPDYPLEQFTEIPQKTIVIKNELQLRNHA